MPVLQEHITMLPNAATQRIFSFYSSVSSSKINTSSTVLPKTLAISRASFKDGLYFPFSKDIIVCLIFRWSLFVPRPTLLIQPVAYFVLCAIHESLFLTLAYILLAFQLFKMNTRHQILKSHYEQYKCKLIH